jgi:hypothetical protein
MAYLIVAILAGLVVYLVMRGNSPDSERTPLVPIVRLAPGSDEQFDALKGSREAKQGCLVFVPGQRRPMFAMSATFLVVRSYLHMFDLAHMRGATFCYEVVRDERGIPEGYVAERRAAVEERSLRTTNGYWEWKRTSRTAMRDQGAETKAEEGEWAAIPDDIARPMSAAYEEMRLRRLL